MKTLALWLATMLALFGVAGGGYDYYMRENPKRVVVVLDTSNPMRGQWDAVRAALDKLDDERYAEFALLRETTRVHGFSDRLSPGNIKPFGPRKLKRFDASKYPEINQASEVWLASNAPTAELPEVMKTWRRLPLD